MGRVTFRREAATHGLFIYPALLARLPSSYVDVCKSVKCEESPNVLQDNKSSFNYCLYDIFSPKMLHFFNMSTTPCS